MGQQLAKLMVAVLIDIEIVFLLFSCINGQVTSFVPGPRLWMSAQMLNVVLSQVVEPGWSIKGGLWPGSKLVVISTVPSPNTV